MKIGILVPYGRFNAERNLISVLGLYLTSFGFDVSMIACDGQLSSCNRDQQNSWNKSLQTCSQCISQSTQLSKMTGFKRISILQYLKSSDENYIRDLTGDFSAKLGQPLNLGKTNLDLLMLGTILERFGKTELDFSDKEQKDFYIRTLQNTLRILFASAKLNTDQEYDLVFIAGGQDYVSASFRQSLIETGTKVVIFRNDEKASVTHIIHHSKSQLISLDLIINSVKDYLIPCKNWNQRTLSDFGQIIDFLEINANQMRLPLAR